MCLIPIHLSCYIHTTYPLDGCGVRISRDCVSRSYTPIMLYTYIHTTYPLGGCGVRISKDNTACIHSTVQYYFVYIVQYDTICTHSAIYVTCLMCNHAPKPLSKRNVYIHTNLAYQLLVVICGKVLDV